MIRSKKWFTQNADDTRGSPARAHDQAPASPVSEQPCPEQPCPVALAPVTLAPVALAGKPEPGAEGGRPQSRAAPSQPGASAGRPGANPYRAGKNAQQWLSAYAEADDVP